MANRFKKAGGRGTGRAGRKGWARLAVKAVLLLAVLAAAGYGASWAAGRAWHRVEAMRLFSVSGVQVSGLRHVRAEDLVSYMGSLEDRSVLTLDMDGLVRTLKAHPWIKDVSVKRELPDGVRLSVRERVPAAVAVDARGGRLVDTEGVVLAKLEGEGWDYLPRIACDRPCNAKSPGGLPDDGFVMSLALIESVRRDPTELLAGAVVHLGADGVPYLIVDGAVVTVGRDGYEEKVRRLAEIFSDVHARGVVPEKVDLRFPGKVVVDDGRARHSWRGRQPERRLAFGQT